ncbi:molybdopterin molybdotransferase MoeA [Jeotgalibacillus haloalkalitolerans]|uniref:Molybdopterin molybdenumtransferase n=1 Tax=Jeotgalibacillus haloalkalitolerans TaxID=3104292 RepID=A0ABU5KQT0_9BACL|nr:gephyrin-like molybdotransferase Glp [Jeotgalibacillus sp. HH7-29]MDZ5713306.1 gephyrin-like molybdotransferase Glp [Jeotgalibacillus sp. HH7-29]
MVEQRKPIPVAEAVQRVIEKQVFSKTEKVHIEKALGRRLAEDLIATHPVPPFDRSPYDGFAVRSADTENASRENPLDFKVTETIGAGSVQSVPVSEFEAARIMTGAMMPSECDAVVMLELTSEPEPGVMRIKRSFQKGDNISFQGEDAKEGTVLVEKGAIVNPGTIALLATFGYEYITAASKPVVGVLATGSELLEVNEPLEPGKIRNSNALMAAAQIERAGAEVKMLGKLSDDLEACYESVKQAMKEVDILITTGGVSVGDFDFLPEVYKRLEAEVLFNKVAMRPGSVTTVAHKDGQFLFGLSGNPSACYVGFELFTRPLIQQMLGNPKPHLPVEKAVLGADFTKPNPFTRFVRGTLTINNGRLEASPSGFNKSSAVSSLAATNCLIVLPGGTRGFTAGDQVKIALLETAESSEMPW